MKILNPSALDDSVLRIHILNLCYLSRGQHLSCRIILLLICTEYALILMFAEVRLRYK